MKDENNISNHSGDCISTDVLLKYIKGELSGYMKNMVERHVTSCEMCSDELEGLSLLEKPEKIDEITLELRRKVDETINLPYREIPYLKFSVQVAALMLILIGVTALYFFFNYKQPKLDYVTLARMELDEIASLGKGGKDTLLLSSCEVVKHEKGLLKVEAVDEVVSLEYQPPVVIDSTPTEKEIVAELNEEKISEVIEDKKNVDDRLAVSESVVQYVPVSASKKVVAGGVAFATKSMVESKNEGLSNLSYSAKKQVAMKLFDKKKYEQALNTFEIISLNLPVSDSILLYKSICYYHLTRFDDAILNLSELARNPQNIQFAEARWYYALSLIGAQRRSEAIVILEQIIKDNSTYKHEATKELIKLKGNQ